MDPRQRIPVWLEYIVRSELHEAQWNFKVRAHCLGFTLQHALIIFNTSYQTEITNNLEDQWVITRLEAQ